MDQIYNIANKKIKINTNFEYKTLDRFNQFRCNEVDFDIEYKFIKTDKYKYIVSEPLYANIEYRVYIEENKIYRNYYTVNNEKPYACLEIFKDNPNYYICYLYPEYTKYNISIRHLFDVMAIEYAMIRLDTIILHSSFISYNNKGILFSAPSQTGKSTQAELWKKYKNAEIINGDRTFLNKENNVWKAYGSPYAGSSNIFINKSVDLKAIVLLQQAEENKIYQQPMYDSYKKLLKEVTINHWDEAFFNKAIDLLLDLINNIDIYTLECLPDEGAVNLLQSVLEE